MISRLNQFLPRTDQIITVDFRLNDFFRKLENYWLNAWWWPRKLNVFEQFLTAIIFGCERDQFIQQGSVQFEINYSIVAMITVRNDFLVWLIYRISEIQTLFLRSENTEDFEFKYIKIDHFDFISTGVSLSQ